MGRVLRGRWTLCIVGLLLTWTVADAEAGAQAQKLKIGLVYDVGGRGDLSFNDLAAVGLDKAAKEFVGKIETKELAPRAGGENREELVRLLARESYDLILATGFLFTDAITSVAKDHRSAKFAIVDGVIPDQPNVVSLLFKEHEGSFLVGAAAALKSTTGKIGFVGGMRNPVIERFEAGYIAGAKYIKPSIQVFSDYAGTSGEAFREPAKGRELALAQYDRGADIIYHASGGTGIGVFEAAVRAKKMAIGVDADQSLTVKPDQRAQILTSMVKRVDVAVFEAIKSVVSGTYKGGSREFGLKEGGVGYAINQYNKAMIQDIVPRLEALKKDIIAGKIRVPPGKKELDAFLKRLKQGAVG